MHQEFGGNHVLGFVVCLFGADGKSLQISAVATVLEPQLLVDRLPPNSITLQAGSLALDHFACFLNRSQTGE